MVIAGRRHQADVERDAHHHAPEVEHIAIIIGEGFGDGFDDLHASAPTA